MRAGVAPWLVVVQDVLAGERVDHALLKGARLSDELMRIFPDGIDGAWRLYNREVDAGTEITPEQAQQVVLSPSDLIILVRTPSGAPTMIQIGLAMLLSAVATLLEPRPSRPRTSQLSEQRESGTNQLAAQQNVLRAGARVPDILGRMRVYPDLLTAPIERWTWPTIQDIEQFFVVGVGAYEIRDRKLGDTPLASIIGSSSIIYGPGQEVAAMPVLRSAPTVDNLSLDTLIGSAEVASDVEFVAATKQLISAERISALPLGVPVVIDGTLYNNSEFWVDEIPPAEQTVGPYVYVLDGPVADEPSVQPIIVPYVQHTGDLVGDTQAAMVPSEFPDIDPTIYSILTYFAYIDINSELIPIGDHLWQIEVTHAGTRFRNRIATMQWKVQAGGTYKTEISPGVDVYGDQVSYGTWATSVTQLRVFKLLKTAVGEARAPRADEPTDPLYTGWITSPIEDATELWIDIAFPQGLIRYVEGTSQSETVWVQAEFRRAGADAAQTTIVLEPFNTKRTSYVRRTDVFNVAELGLPGSGAVEVRLKRMTAIVPDTSTVQSVNASVWASFRAAKVFAPRVYPDVTIMHTTVRNSRSATSAGANSFNVVATRIVPRWNGSVWLMTESEKWADNFIQRCHALDGANRDYSDIDVSGIYAVQAHLDTLDAGAQGKIALALDQLQDIDAELAQIADVVRAVVYRVGRKLYVARDQANATPIALFNGRTKSAEGETISVRMKSDDEHDAVQVQWYDEVAGWKLREFIYTDPPNPTPSNVLRVAPVCANWPQAFRRAVYEWNKIRYRREQIAVNVTEDGRICRPGDVVHITDDVANLAIAAGELLYISGLTLVVDHPLDFSAPGTYSILLRDVAGAAVDVIPCSVVAGVSNRVQLARAPTVTIKGRDEALGTLYAFYNDAAVNSRKWLLTSVEASGQQVTLSGFNYTALVYEGDGLTLPARPPLGT
jgi:hypothetical protein